MLVLAEAADSKPSVSLNGRKYELPPSLYEFLAQLVDARVAGDGWIRLGDFGVSAKNAQTRISRLKKKLGTIIETRRGGCRITLTRNEIEVSAANSAPRVVSTNGPRDIEVRGIDAFPFRHVAIISPHPDDSVLGCGGLVSKLIRHQAATRVSIFVMTPGYRGVDSEFFHHSRLEAEDAVQEWLNKRFGDFDDPQKLVHYLKELLGDSFEQYGGKGDTDEVKATNVLKTALRWRESRKEAIHLGLDPDKDLRFLALTSLYSRRIEIGELRRLQREIQSVVHSDSESSNQPCLLLVPHPEDDNSAHRATTEIAVRALSTEVDWHVWYYQSPWFRMAARDVDVILPLDHMDNGIKMQAASEHKSQTDRTPYDAIVEHSGLMMAEVLPEPILGFGATGSRTFGKYTEVYSIRAREFYTGESPIHLYCGDPRETERAFPAKVRRRKPR